MKKFWLRVVLYTGYLSLAGWIVIGLPVLLFTIDFSYPYAELENSMHIIKLISKFIIDTILSVSIYLLIITSSIRGTRSIKKILKGIVPSKFDILYIVLLIIASISFWVWMGAPYD